LSSRIPMYARFMRDLPGFLRKRLTLEDAHRWVREKLANREESFLRLIQRGVYTQPKSPYRFLLKEAGCEYGDLVKLVGEEGLEGALVVHRRDDLGALGHALRDDRLLRLGIAFDRGTFRGDFGLSRFQRRQALTRVSENLRGRAGARSRGSQ